MNSEFQWVEKYHNDKIKKFEGILDKLIVLSIYILIASLYIVVVIIIDPSLLVNFIALSILMIIPIKFKLRHIVRDYLYRKYNISDQVVMGYNKYRESEDFERIQQIKDMKEQILIEKEEIMRLFAKKKDMLDTSIINIIPGLSSDNNETQIVGLERD